MFLFLDDYSGKVQKAWIGIASFPEFRVGHENLNSDNDVNGLKT